MNPATTDKVTLPPLICPYCGSPSQLVDAVVVYRRAGFGSVWVCQGYPACDAYVGAHRNGLPKGSLANKELREWRKRAHAAFDPLWQSGKMSRTKAYGWLSCSLGIPKHETHIAMFDVERCRAVVELVRT